MRRYSYGVHLADFPGPAGEFILLAFRSNGRLAFDPVYIPFGAPSHRIVEETEARLEAIEPDRRKLLKVVNGSPTAPRAPRRLR